MINYNFAIRVRQALSVQASIMCELCIHGRQLFLPHPAFISSVWSSLCSMWCSMGHPLPPVAPEPCLPLLPGTSTSYSLTLIGGVHQSLLPVVQICSLGVGWTNLSLKILIKAQNCTLVKSPKLCTMCTPINNQTQAWSLWSNCLHSLDEDAMFRFWHPTINYLTFIKIYLVKDYFKDFLSDFSSDFSVRQAKVGMFDSAHDLCKLN